jgi:hypothetical protein
MASMISYQFGLGFRSTILVHFGLACINSIRIKVPSLASQFSLHGPIKEGKDFIPIFTGRARIFVQISAYHDNSNRHIRACNRRKK